MNTVILSGRLVESPSTSVSSTGITFTRITIAVDRASNEKGDNGAPLPGFFRATAFGKTAEFISNYFEKGSPIEIQGSLQHDKWTTEEGEKRSSVAIVVERANFVPGSRPRSESEEPAPVRQAPSKPSRSKKTEDPDLLEDLLG